MSVVVFPTAALTTLWPHTRPKEESRRQRYLIASARVWTRPAHLLVKRLRARDLDNARATVRPIDAIFAPPALDNRNYSDSPDMASPASFEIVDNEPRLILSIDIGTSESAVAVFYCSRGKVERVTQSYTELILLCQVPVP